ncbi:serine hydrolase domain-containing protein [Parvibaculum sp.]|uniref:serine hydrolase domain-containing protein n=1 Tax=Parvibaculum sp. TaxID=2024848 RepID=UPI0026009349|nr:serine hydrolase domain-containing protein [Parvibaculum sp.]
MRPSDCARVRASLIGFCLVLLTMLAALPGAQASDARVDGGMARWPVGDMARALDDYLPRRMAEEDVPGLAVAVIRKGVLVFEKGYGLADALGDRKVSANTLFEAGALGKSVAAYTAMRMVGARLLTLGEPVAEDGQAVPLRQVLEGKGRRAGIVSGIWQSRGRVAGADLVMAGGYGGLARVMEDRVDAPFERIVTAYVFKPFDMLSSGYRLPEALTRSVARGYVPLWQALAAVFLPWLAMLALALPLAFAAVHFLLDRIRMVPRDFAIATAGAFAAAMVPMGLFIGWPMLAAVLAYAITFLVCLGLAGFLFWRFLALVYRPGQGVLRRGHRGEERALVFGILLALIAGVFFLERNVPVPTLGGNEPRVALSLRSSAHDLGLFAEGFLASKGLDPALRDMMIGDGREPALGFHTRSTRDGFTLWQSGDRPGFSSLVVIHPLRGDAVVLLANTNKAADLVQEAAAQIMGMEAGWRLP